MIRWAMCTSTYLLRDSVMDYARSASLPVRKPNSGSVRRYCRPVLLSRNPVFSRVARPLHRLLMV